MTPDEIRSDVEPLANEIMLTADASLDSYSPGRERKRIVTLLLAARKRWRNETLEEAATVRVNINDLTSDGWVRVGAVQDEIRALKEE